MDIPYFFSDQIKKLPDAPGVYRFYNRNRKLIYVGKAKNLKKRVTSYFNRNRAENRKTLRMVAETKTIEFTILNSEFDALHLENNLIKKNQPRYNIQLKDDKSFPFVCITHERFPRIYSTRRLNPDIGRYYGPYTNVKAMNNVLYLIRNLYTLRTCKYNLSEKNVEAGKFNVCLEYHIQNCQGPCEGLQTEGDYNKDIEMAINILKGKLGIVKDYFKEQMKMHVELLEFELADKFKSKLQLLEKFQSKSLIVNPRINDLDVFTIVSVNNLSFVNYFHVKKGAISIAQTIEVKKRLEQQDDDILPNVILELRERFVSRAKEIITNIPLTIPWEQVKHQVPQRGDKKKLIELSLKNSKFYQREKITRQGPAVAPGLLRLQKDLKLRDLPHHIECFDNSNMGGSQPVASMVYFKDGKPLKRQYRHYNIKSVKGPDDFASMHEIVHRRYSLLLKSEEKLPDLIIVDGGKGQLSAAMKALKELGIYGQIPIIGIAKRLEEIYYPEDPYPLHIEKKSESLKLIQRIRNEAHRFAVTFHRQKRSKGSLNSQLSGIKGLGEQSIKALLQEFKSLEKIRSASAEEVSRVIGSHRSKLLSDHFSSQ